MIKKTLLILTLLISNNLINLTTTLSIFNQQQSSNSFAIDWGLSARISKRPTMEDAHQHIISLNNKNDAFFAVYDGHGGVEAANLAEQNLHKFLPKSDFNTQSFKHAFLETDKIILANSTKSGSCAVTAYINNDDLYIAWAGDSRAILARDGKVFFATEDHKPDNPEEEQRIKNAGGFVSFYDVPRVNGQLAVARALGDKSLKPNLLIADPNVKHLKIQKDDILILACDGIWDVLSNEEAVELVQKSLSKSLDELKIEYPEEKAKQQDKKFFEELSTHDIEESGNSEKFKLVARALRDTAYNKRSGDNLSVEIITFSLPL